MRILSFVCILTGLVALAWGGADTASSLSFSREGHLTGDDRVAESWITEEPGGALKLWWRDADETLFSRTSTDGGITFSPAVEETEEPPAPDRYPATVFALDEVIADDGRIFQLWSEVSGGPLFFRMFDGDAWTPATQIAPSGVGLSIAAEGDLVLAVWFSAQTDYDSFMRSSTNGGGTWGPTVEFTGPDDACCDTALIHAGNVVSAVFSEQGTTIKAYAGGNLGSQPTTVNLVKEGTPFGSYGSLLEAPNGDLVAMWEWGYTGGDSIWYASSSNGIVWSGKNKIAEYETDAPFLWGLRGFGEDWYFQWQNNGLAWARYSPDGGTTLEEAFVVRGADGPAYGAPRIFEFDGKAGMVWGSTEIHFAVYEGSQHVYSTFGEAFNFGRILYLGAPDASPAGAEPTLSEPLTVIYQGSFIGGQDHRVYKIHLTVTGDADCDVDVDTADVLSVLADQRTACYGSYGWDCGDLYGTQQALRMLMHLAGVPWEVEECPDIGT